MNSLKEQSMSPEIAEKIIKDRVIAVLVVDELKHAVPLAKALVKGGVNVIELTLRTPVALDAVKAINNEVPEITLGVGTVLTSLQVEAVAKIGADFAVAPGCNPSVIKAAKECGLSFAPGIMTPTDIEIAVELGCRILKYFPAESSGGLKHLQSMVSPYQYLGLKFIPLGGLNIQNVAAYLQSSLIAAVGGSWIAKRSLIQAENWDAIIQNAQEIRKLIEKTTL
jgi:2-dehydro-3-deoxyphosphogluconate aldolase/(4S)-4-hydroxy-2-oxoglutarate aldolase